MEELSDEKNIINRFNVRVYGIAMNNKSEILLCTESFRGITFTKFPGGGLEFGEGLHQCLHREFKEELNIEIDILDHFYTTDFFQQSAFVKTDQLLSIYYWVKLKTEPRNYDVTNDNIPIHFFWKPISELKESDVTFPIDKIVINKLKIEN